METLLNHENALEVTIPAIPTSETLEVEIWNVSQRGPEAAGQYVAEKAANVKDMSEVVIAAGRTNVRSMYAAGSVIRIMRDTVLAHAEYEKWVRDVCKIDPSTAWKWAEFSIRAHGQDLDSHKSRRQALIAAGIIKDTKAIHAAKSLLRSPVKALRAAPAPAQKSSTAASPSKRIKKTAPPPKAVTQVALSLPAAIKQLEDAIAASVKRPAEELSAEEREELQAMVGKLIALTRRLKEAICPKLRTEIR